MRAFRALPVAGADKNFAVALTLFAMKFVNRHEPKITFYCGKTSGIKLNRRKRRQPRLFVPFVCFCLFSGRQFFAVRQMVAVPADQGGVAGVFKKKLQRRRFDVAVAKHRVGAALMT